MDIITLGEAFIDFFAAQSGFKLSEVSNFIRVPGGAPANVAVGAAKLGAKSSFIGRVGDDYFGRFLEDTLKLNNVDTSLMQFDNYARTGLAFVAVPTPTTQQYLFYRNPGADMMLSADEFDASKIQKTKIFHFGSISLISNPSREATLKAVDIAKSGGAIISYDPNLRMSLWPEGVSPKRQLKEVINLADVIKLNDTEIKFIFEDKSIDEGISEILSLGPKLCILTMGSEGSVYATKDFRGSVKTFLDVPAVDTTGCGDSFVAALLVGIIEENFDLILKNEKSVIEIIKRASAAATLTSTKKGVIPALPTKGEVDLFLKNY
ncbi:MAG: PfkB family carbohydrate kinase [Actinomycetota bacterium]